MSITLSESSESRVQRPWGLRGMRPVSWTGLEVPKWRYDHERQVAVGEDGERLCGPAMSARTFSVPDPGQEDTLPDFVPDTAE